MLKQAADFYEESKLLYELLKEIESSEFENVTQFKNWTYNDVIRHLHTWNYAINLSLKDKDRWKKFLIKLEKALESGQTLKQFEKLLFKGVRGKNLLSLWKDYCMRTRELFKDRNPKERIEWVGPDMSVLSAISSRQMETWAHGQSIFDDFGIERKNTDRIFNIVIIGKNTFKWSFQVNNMPIPSEMPYLKLKAPSGKDWKFNSSNNENIIEGKAEDFCKVVTQVRNIDDLKLKVEGKVAKKWMEIAQCFAGKAEKPPISGSRKIRK